jgi:hypothetical protein
VKENEIDRLDLLSNPKIVNKVRIERFEHERFKEAKNVELNHSNMQNDSEHELRKSTKQGFLKSLPIDPNQIKLADGGE